MEKINIKKFNEYVHEKLRIGLNDKQIATSLGMSLKHFHSILNGEENKKDIPTAPKNEKVKPKKPVIEEKPFPVKNDTVPEPDYGSFAETQETEKIPETK